MLLLLTSSALAAPFDNAFERRSNGSTIDSSSGLSAWCTSLGNSCVANVNANLTNIWATSSCVAFTSCYATTNMGVQVMVDTVYNAKNDGKAGEPAVSSLGRPSEAVFTALSTGTISSQNYIDFVYANIPSNGPYPESPAPIAAAYASVQGWTGYCSASIPRQNFADWLQYSATVNSTACNPASSISSEQSCQSMFQGCISAVASDLHDFFAQRTCVLLSLCVPGDMNVDASIAAVYKQKGGTGTAPTSATIAAQLNIDVFYGWANSGSMSKQNFFDAWYSTISAAKGTFPVNTDQILPYFKKLQEFTGFCFQSVPYANAKDYFRYSSSNPAKVCSSSTNPQDYPLPGGEDGDNGACKELSDQCAGYQSDGRTVFATDACLVAALCIKTNVNDLIKYIWVHDYLTISQPETYPLIPAASQPRMTDGAFFQITGGAQVMTQQNYIDAYYGVLGPRKAQFAGAPPGSTSGNAIYGLASPGPFPPSADFAVRAYVKAQAWTNFCGQPIPKNNFADYLQYAPTIKGARSSC